MADSEESESSSITPRLKFTMAVQSPPRGSTLGDLPIGVIVKILVRLPFTSLPAASMVCFPFHEIIKSPQFSRAYDEQNKNHRWIVTDNSGGVNCNPSIFLYDISLNHWHTLPISKIWPPGEAPLNPKMVSAYGGLILFTATKRGNNGEPLQERELLVLNPLTRETRRLPDPPLFLSSSNPCDECIEMVGDRSGLSYKVIILSLKVEKGVFIYDGSSQDWHIVRIPEILPPGIEPGCIVSSRGVLYEGILCWLVLIDVGSSFLIFYDTQRDALVRETLHITEAELCGIAVCGGEVLKISRYTVGIRWYPELRIDILNEDSSEWELDNILQHPALGWDPLCLKMITGHRMVACSEEDVMWIVCLVAETKFSYGRSVLQRRMVLFSYDIVKDEWQMCRGCDTGETEEKWPPAVKSLISHRPLSQAKVMPLRFTAAV